MMKPMLAAKATSADIEYPSVASPKLDGIRCVIHDGVALSRSMKPIRNKHVQNILGKSEFNGLDGELIVGSPVAHDVYRATNSAVMSINGEPEFKFFVFDDFECKEEIYLRRVVSLQGKIFNNNYMSQLEFLPVVNESALLFYESHVLKLGYEGVILRNTVSPYKHGRSTLKEGFLLKLKRFTDAEATVIGVEELLHNNNEAQTNELGLTYRTSHQGNKEAGNMLGALVCKTPEGVTFKIGTGFDQETRKQLWIQGCVGKIVKYKYFNIGVKDAPRHPVFLGFRDKEDL